MLRLMASTLMMEAHVSRTLVRGRPRALFPVRSSAAFAEEQSVVQHIWKLATKGDLSGVAHAMEALTPEMLAIRVPPSGHKSSRIGYQHVYSDAQLSIGIFLLPRGEASPPCLQRWPPPIAARACGRWSRVHRSHDPSA